MKELFIVLALFGLAYIVGHSKISLPFRIALSPADADRSFVASLRRIFVALIECVACFGFWEGFTVAWLGYWAPFGGGAFGLIAAGCLVAATNLIFGAWSKLV